MLAPTVNEVETETALAESEERRGGKAWGGGIRMGYHYLKTEK